MNNKKIFLISGPSGVGKKTLIETFINNPELSLSYSISMTTRKPRDNEKNNIDYYFVSDEVFKEYIDNNQMIEWAEFSSNKYGTRKSEIERIFARNKSVLLEIEVQGALQIFSKKSEYNIVSIFIAPPSIENLLARLDKRGTETLEEKQIRIEIAKKEIEYQKYYDYVVINDDLETASKQIQDIILKSKND